MTAPSDVAQSLANTPTASQWNRIGIRKHTGIAIPLFSLHSKESCGIGEYPDLLPIIEWCSSVGFDVIQLLPLNDTGQDASPYSAISACALNPLHLGLTVLPYSFDDPLLKSQIDELQLLNELPRVDYPAVRLGKEKFLRQYYQKYGTKTTETKEFSAFEVKNSEWLTSFTLFKALKVIHDWENWESWPEEHRNPPPSFFDNIPEHLEAEMKYQAFIQYHCFQQFKQVKEAADRSAIFIKGDIPILINRDSADVWRHRHLFKMEYAAGAPPDMYSKEGQRWGFPLYNWDVIAKEGYKWWIQRLHVASIGYHIYRIDHIVGFFRIWAIPDGKPAKEGFFIPSDPSTWIAHGKSILEMMIKNCTMLPIGEDLGTIPPEVRTCLKALGICGTKVMRWERNWEGDKLFINPKTYIAESMTTVSTHDSETLAQWWKDNPEDAKLYAEATGLPYSLELTPENRAAILYDSYHSGSLFHINLLQEVLALIPWMGWQNPEDERINVPGTISETNWSFKFKPTVEQITYCIPLKQSIRIQNDL